MPSIIELDIGRADAPGTYEIEVIQSPAGEASATFELEPAQLIDKLDELQQTLLASSVSSRGLVGRGEASVRSVGQRLFEALFANPQVAGVYRASSAVAAERGENLRIVLRLSASELSTLPWESMFDPSTASYVSRREPLVRYVPVPSSPPPLKVRLPLRILALIASPRGLAQLDIEKERENLTRALQPLLESGSVAVEWLEHATWPTVQDRLLADCWHIVHFIGHGDFDIDREEGVLALENDYGRLNRIPADSVVDLLREAQPMPRLVVLNACESSTSSQSDLFSGVAAALVRGGVSAVTAMQFEISDQAAIAFSRGFYTAIGHGRSVDEAVRSGRVAIVGLGADSLEWITPTLYLRGQEGHLFDLTHSTSEAMSEPVLAERRSHAAEATNQRDAATAVPLYDSVLAENPDDESARQGRARAVDAARQAQGRPDSQTGTPYRKPEPLPQPAKGRNAAWRFNPPPGWPPPPLGWIPPKEWTPPSNLPPAPPGWNWWIDDTRAVPPIQDSDRQEELPSAATVDAHQIEYPDRLEDLWAVATLIPWRERPSKSLLKPLRTALRPDEQVVGCQTISVGLMLSILYVVTDQNLHLGTDYPKSRMWREIRHQLSPYLPNESRARIPLKDIDTVEIKKLPGIGSFLGDREQIILTGMGHVRLSIKVWASSANSDLSRLKSYLAQANELARGREQH